MCSYDNTIDKLLLSHIRSYQASHCRMCLYKLPIPSFVPLRLLSPSFCIYKNYDIMYETELYKLTLRRSGSVSLKCILCFSKMETVSSGRRSTSASRIGKSNANPLWAKSTVEFA